MPDTTGSDDGGGGTDPEGEPDTAVNMEGLNVAPEGVYIAGTWQGWDAGATPMTEVNGSGFGPTPQPMRQEPFKYKFINGNAWGQDESVPAACADGIDRFHTVGATDEVLDAVCYGTCNFVQGLTWRPNVLETSTTTDHTTSLMCLRCCPI